MTPAEQAAADWLAKAEADRKAAQVLLHSDVPREVVAFHTQQWAEKSLKAALSARGEEPPRTHDLSVLVSRVGRGTADAGVAAAATELTPYAVLARYPGLESDLDAAQCGRLMAHAGLLSDWARRLLP